MCYRTKFGHSMSNHSGIGRESQKFWRMLGPAPLGWGRGDPPRNMLQCANFGHSGSNCMSVIMEICEKKILPHGVPLFKVTRSHWNQHGSIGNLWLPISDP